MDLPVKILVVGNSGVGKTSLCNRYMNDRFNKAYKPTVGGIFFFKFLKELFFKAIFLFLFNK
jgi:GTPase SAR1 family protein